MVTGTLPYDKEKMLEGIYAMLGTGRESDLHGIVSVSDAAIGAVMEKGWDDCKFLSIPPRQCWPFVGNSWYTGIGVIWDCSPDDTDWMCAPQRDGGAQTCETQLRFAGQRQGKRGRIFHAARILECGNQKED